MGQMIDIAMAALWVIGFGVGSVGSVGDGVEEDGGRGCEVSGDIMDLRVMAVYVFQFVEVYCRV